MMCWFGMLPGASVFPGTREPGRGVIASRVGWICTKYLLSSRYVYRVRMQASFVYLPTKAKMSGIFSWLSSLLSSLLASLGLAEKNGTILLLGLDNAGKTTLLHRLRTGTVQHFPPTDRPNRETFEVEGGVAFQAW
jgi:hypothetical protein